METKKGKKKRKWKQYLATIFFMLIGGICGVWIGSYMDKMDSAGKSLSEILMGAAALFVGMYVAMIVQIIIHEAGHLIFGLWTGYEFSSFRIFSFMWMKIDGKIKFKRFSLAGTSGQCLMNPPDLVDGKIPYVLYNLGGSIVNVVSAGIFLLLYFVSRGIPMLSYWFLMLAVIGGAFALINGVPMRMGTVDNDGYNALSLGKDPQALRSFWIRMKANHAQSLGQTLKDMPEEWFVMPSDEEMKNSMVAPMGVFACNRLMEEKRFDEADAEMKRLLDLESGIVGLHRNLMISDRMFCELLGECRMDVVNQMYTKEQKQFMKAMGTFLAVIRTEYAYALLGEQDEKKAEAVKKRFEKAATKYPYAGDLQIEREYVALADEKYKKSKNG